MRLNSALIYFKIIFLTISRRFRDNYSPFQWAANGPQLLTYIMNMVCHKQQTEDMTRENCEGFKVYDSSYFYAVSNREYRDAFDINPEKVKRIFKLIENSTLVHMSNTLSKSQAIRVGSPEAYAVLAEMYCPRVYSTLDTFF